MPYLTIELKRITLHIRIRPYCLIGLLPVEYTTAKLCKLCHKKMNIIYSTTMNTIVWLVGLDLNWTFKVNDITIPTFHLRKENKKVLSIQFCFNMKWNIWINHSYIDHCVTQASDKTEKVTMSVATLKEKEKIT